jgi:hypothetical protein
MNHNWYLAPLVTDEDGVLQVGSNGVPYNPTMMMAHVGPASGNPTQSLVGVRKGFDFGQPGDWTPVDPGDFVATFNTLFARNPEANEQFPE